MLTAMKFEERDGRYPFCILPNSYINQYISGIYRRDYNTGLGRHRLSDTQRWYWKLTKNYAKQVTETAFPWSSGVISSISYGLETWIDYQQGQGNLSGDPWMLAQTWMMDMPPIYGWNLRWANAEDHAWYTLAHAE
jgi:hypothetical protein